eukprot:2226197-Lingulodinium_polyedra.AAC.1
MPRRPVASPMPPSPAASRTRGPRHWPNWAASRLGTPRGRDACPVHEGAQTRNLGQESIT